MAAMTDMDLQKIREEVGSNPSDNTVEDTWDSVGGGIIQTSLAILRPRLADALAAAAQGSVAFPGAISVGAPSQPTMLLEQIQRLEAVLAAETGTADEGAVGAVTVMRRRDQLRGVPFLP
jgi:hypothetical protein